MDNIFVFRGGKTFLEGICRAPVPDNATDDELLEWAKMILTRSNILPFLWSCVESEYKQTHPQETTSEEIIDWVKGLVSEASRDYNCLPPIVVLID